jgi:uncharacterized protein (DUF1778 family)
MKKKSVRKKKVIKKKMKKVGRPRGTKTYVELGLQATPEERDLIDKGATAEAQRLGWRTKSRNNFCLRAALAAAKKELRDAGEDVA